MALLPLVTALLAFNGLVCSEIYVFGDGLSDGSKMRTLVTVDDVPLIFINKGKGTDIVMTRIECTKKKFIISSDENVVRKIRFENGSGEVEFSLNNTTARFSEGIERVSWSNGGTGVGPWPIAFVLKIIDLRFLPRNTAESLYLIDNYIDLVKDNKIGDNRK